jgi:hypothetical protein
LEGFQDVLLVVHVPQSLGGICIQATLDTGHRAAYQTPLDTTQRAAFQATAPATIVPIMMLQPPGAGSGGGGGGGRPVFGSPEVYADPNQEILDAPPLYQLVVTRRVVRSCGKFNESGGLTVTGAGAPALPNVVFETLVPGPSLAATSAVLRTGEAGQVGKLDQANALNAFQHEVTQAMLGGISTIRPRLRPFVQTDTFRRLAVSSLTRLDVGLQRLVEAELMDADVAEQFMSAGVRTVGDLFQPTLASRRGTNLVQLGDARKRVLDSALAQAAKLRRAAAEVMNEAEAEEEEEPGPG